MRYGSAKISAEIINKLIADNTTGNETSVLIWLALYQDEYGRVFNVKYKDVCKDMAISSQGYYDCINGLEQKGYIRVINRSYSAGWDIEILNNMFVTKQDDKKRYLNINRGIFFSGKFLNLRANEKKIIMRILLEYKADRNYFANIRKIGAWIGIDNIQLLRSYINKIKEFFKIGHKNGDKKSDVIIFQRCNAEVERPAGGKSIFYHYTKLKLKAMLRRFKVNYTDEEMDNLIILVNQYKEHFNILSQVIIDTVEKKKSVQPKYINLIMTSRLNPQA